jgi:hypothetical protein
MKTQATPSITGHGHTHDGRRVFAVASRSETNRWYLVTVGENALSCDCKAGKFHPETPCAHRKIVHDRLVSERDAAPMYRSNAPFSIWKS